MLPVALQFVPAAPGSDGRGSVRRAVLTLNTVFPRDRGFNLVHGRHVDMFGVTRREATCSTGGESGRLRPDRWSRGCKPSPALFHQRSHTYGVTCVFHEHQKVEVYGRKPPCREIPLAIAVYRTREHRSGCSYPQHLR